MNSQNFNTSELRSEVLKEEQLEPQTSKKSSHVIEIEDNANKDNET